MNPPEAGFLGLPIWTDLATLEARVVPLSSMRATIARFGVGPFTVDAHALPHSRPNLGFRLTAESFLLAGVLAYAPRQRRTTWQAVGFSAVMVMVAVVVAVRTLMLA